MSRPSWTYIPIPTFLLVAQIKIKITQNKNIGWWQIFILSFISDKVNYIIQYFSIMCSNLRSSFCPENSYLWNSSCIHLNWFFVKLDFSESSQLPSCLLKMKYDSHYINPSLTVILVSVQFSCSVMSNSLWPHGLQHARFPCPSPTPEACSNSSPSSQ